MTVDALNWARFTDSRDIPEWISTAYADSYQGPHNDEAEADSGSAPESLPAPAVTPALLSAHYRLGSHRPTGESRVAVYPHDDPSGFGPALQVITDDGAMLMDSVTVLLHRLGVAYLAIMNPVFHVRRDGTGDLLAVGPKDLATTGSMRPGSMSSSCRRWTVTPYMKPNASCRGCWPTCAESQRIQRR